MSSYVRPSSVRSPPRTEISIIQCCGTDRTRSSSPTARDHHLRPHEIIITDRTRLSSLSLILIVTAIGHGGHSVSSILAHVIQLHSFDSLLKVLFDNIQAEASTPDRRFVCVSLKACAIVFA